MSNNPIKDMYDNKMTPEVKAKFLDVRAFMLTKGNIICTNCGGEMVGNTGCYQCPNCGNKDCGS